MRIGFFSPLFFRRSPAAPETDREVFHGSVRMGDRQPAVRSWARKFLRSYGWKRLRIGRSQLKKILRPFLRSQYQIDIRSGLRMKLDLSYSNQNFIFWFYEEVEPALQWTIKNLLPVGGIIVDCGANVGLMGLLAIHERQAYCYFIEPLPRLAETIRRSLSVSNYQNRGSVLQVATSSCDGEADLYVHPTNDGGHSLRPLQQQCEKIRVKLCKLRTILGENRMERIDLLKVDTEGHDYEVLCGLEDFLDPSKTRMIFVEMAENTEPITDLLSHRGYCCFQAAKVYIDRLRQLKRMEDECMVSYFMPTDRCEAFRNALWVGRGTAEEELLRRIADIGIRAD